MAAEVASAFVALMPSAKRFGPQLDSQISGQVGRSGKRAGGLLGGAMTAATRHVGPLIGAATVAGFAKKAVGLEASFSSTMNQMSRWRTCRRRDQEALGPRHQDGCRHRVLRERCGGRDA
jgi:hypothetical protein